MGVDDDDDDDRDEDEDEDSMMINYNDERVLEWNANNKQYGGDEYDHHIGMKTTKQTKKKTKTELQTVLIKRHTRCMSYIVLPNQSKEKIHLFLVFCFHVMDRTQ